jgi:hypothetical protein
MYASWFAVFQTLNLGGLGYAVVKHAEFTKSNVLLLSCIACGMVLLQLSVAFGVIRYTQNAGQKVSALLGPEEADLANALLAPTLTRWVGWASGVAVALTLVGWLAVVYRAIT